MQKIIYSKEDIYEAMKLTYKLAIDHKMSTNCGLKLQLVTEEACTNAYEYGRKHGIASFLIHWSISEKVFDIMIQQKGQVFSLQNNGDTPLTGLRGRGIPLILSIMDQVDIREHKNHIQLFMRRERI